MYKELTVKIGKDERKIFLQKGLPSVLQPSPYHKHNYTEVHLIAGGNVKFAVGDSIIEVPAGSLFVIPDWHLHGCIEKDKNILSASFQIDMKLEKAMRFNISEDVIKSFVEEIKECETNDDYTKLSAYLCLFGSYIPGHQAPEVKKITDFSFLLREFFFNNYSNTELKLKYLADELHVSERQAERIVMKYTGNTFKKEVMLTRVSVAKYLLKFGNMSLSEIAATVGYHSYAGFWKAMKKQKLL